MMDVGFQGFIMYAFSEWRFGRLVCVICSLGILPEVLVRL